MTLELVVRILIALLLALVLALVIALVVYSYKVHNQEKRIAFLERRLEYSRKVYDARVKNIVEEYDDAMKKMARKINILQSSQGK